MLPMGPDHRAGLVSIALVNWNGGQFLPACLEAIWQQEYMAIEVIAVDNASTDGSREYLQAQRNLHLIANETNRGFARALNQALEYSRGEFFLSLNPDTRMTPAFVHHLVERLQEEEQVGLATGKLLRPVSGAGRILDSTGLYIDRQRRTYDRGQGEADEGQYDNLPYTFGACGAAAFYRHKMLDDLAVQGECFDELFFAYYEDADISWRAQLRDWSCAYVPTAVAYHARGQANCLRKEGHGGKDPAILAWSWRNRYLMTLKNDRLGYLVVDLPWIVASELPRFAYMAWRTPRALRGPVELYKSWNEAMRKRTVVQSRRKVPHRQVRRWFTHPELASRGGPGESSVAFLRTQP